MTDRTTRTYDEPPRPPRGPAGVSPPSPRIVALEPDVMATLGRIATAFETIAAALAVPEDADTVELRYCAEPIWQRGVDGKHLPVEAPGTPLFCTRPVDHLPGHVSRDEAGVMLACQLCRGDSGKFADMICPACRTDYTVKTS